MAEEDYEDVPPGCGPKTCACILRYYTSITRVLGIVFLLVMWGIAVKVVTIADQVPFGVGLIIITAFVSFMELTWVINKCCCFREDSCPTKFWNGVMWIDNWRRSILYIPLSIVCFIHPKSVPIAIANGVLLNALALLYLIRGCIDEEADPKRPYFNKPRQRKKKVKYDKLASEDKSTDAEKGEEETITTEGEEVATPKNVESTDVEKTYGSDYYSHK